MKTNEERIESMIQSAGNQAKWATIGSMRNILETIQAEKHLQPLLKEFISGRYSMPSLHTYTNTISFTITPRKVEEIIPFIKFLRKEGYKRSNYSTQLKDTATPQWGFKKEGTVVIIVADFSKNSGDNVCSFKEVGKETKEVPVMKLVCPENDIDFEAVDEKEGKEE